MTESSPLTQLLSSPPAASPATSLVVPNGTTTLEFGSSPASLPGTFAPMSTASAATSPSPSAPVNPMTSMSGSGRQHLPTEDGWQDRDIRFDAPLDLLTLRTGEVSVDSAEGVEDTKGNVGDRGTLVVTNLRIIWRSSKSQRVNLSIGLSCVVALSLRSIERRLMGATSALFVMTKVNSSRFEFIFTSLLKESPRVFASLVAVHKSYESTRMFRDLKLRSAVVKDKTLIELHKENVIDKIDGVWNLSSDQGNLGTMFVTNIRIVWHSNLAENFNVSLPFLQIVRHQSTYDHHVYRTRRLD